MIDIIHELRTTNSKLAKERILQKHKENEAWKAYLLEVYNPFIVYGQSGNKNELQSDLENLKLCRSINAGITAVTINKVYGNLIPTASRSMKAYDYGKKAKTLPFPMYGSIKYDGNYVNIISNNGLTFYTSGGHEYSHNIDMDLPSGYVYMAERIDDDGKLGKRRGVALEGSRGAKYAKPSNHYKIFDCVALDDFFSGYTEERYDIRRTRIPKKYRVDEILIENIEDAEILLDELVSQGYEGIMLKAVDMKWRDSKSRRVDQVKWKKRQSVDLLCIEEIEGEGNSQGIIGSLRLRDSVGREFNVGSGLSLNGDLPFGSYLGKVVEIEYEHINPEGTYIQPVVLMIREDKDKTDID